VKIFLKTQVWNIVFCVIAGVLTIASSSAVAAEETADAIYIGGPIVTMIRDNDRVEALAVKGGKILKTGSRNAILSLKGPETKVLDLKGKAMMPGFIDPHSHVVLQAAKFATVNLDPYPIGDIKSIADIQRKLRERIEKRPPRAGGVVIGWGYDDTGLQEKRHPNRDDLDAVSREHPILLMHISSHFMAANSKMLELAGVNARTPDPPGGRFQRKAGGQEPNGVMEETAMDVMLKVVPKPTAEETASLIEEGLRRYAAEGITTAQDGGSFPGIIKLFRSMAASGKLPIDVVAYPVTRLGLDDALVDEIARTWKNWGRFRIGGIKLVGDGSIQGYTAYLSAPYFKGPGQQQAETDQCQNPVGTELVLGQTDVGDSSTSKAPPASTDAARGYPLMSQEEMNKWLRLADSKGIPVLVHANGDATIDMLINAVETARGDLPRPDLRTTIIHAQTMREDQLDFAASNGLVPSFFPIHVVFWGDRHRDLFLGPDRAARIDPSRSALDRGMKITLHHDAPIAHWGMLPVVSAAVNRVTTGGKVLGPDQRISIYEAFRAVTKDAAWQYFEENRKGTLEAGKLADMVILDRDPLKTDPGNIADIKVLETIKEGKTVFQKE